MRNPFGLTFGVELEWPDVDVNATLLSGWSWSETDYTIVNNNGVANDPKRTLIPWGGELNSPVYDNPNALFDQLVVLWRRMRPGYNYRSNFHVHLGIPDDLRTVPTLRQIEVYTRTHLKPLIDYLDPLDPLYVGQTTLPALTAAKKRLNHSKRSRHYFIPQNYHDERFDPSVTEVEDLLACEVPTRWDGAPAWALAPREAVNLRSIRKHGTIEFRCFAGPHTPQEAMAAVSFAFDWLNAAITDQPEPEKIVRLWRDYLPQQLPFRQTLEDGWQETNLQHHSRDEVRSLLVQRGLI